MTTAIIMGKAAATWLAADFLSGLLHWLEDAYGGPFWPIFGQHVTKPNILHHYVPRAFVTNSWYLSSRLLLLVCSLIALVAMAAGAFNWMVALGLLLGVNANQVHKWSHRTRQENGAAVRLLQRLRLVQSPAHHHRHHTLGKNTHYCVLTDFLNPVLDRARFWAGLEWLIARVVGVQRRDDGTAAAQVLDREPEFFGEHVDLIRQRLAVARAARSVRSTLRHMGAVVALVAGGAASAPMFGPTANTLHDRQGFAWRPAQTAHVQLYVERESSAERRIDSLGLRADQARTRVLALLENATTHSRHGLRRGIASQDEGPDR